MLLDSWLPTPLPWRLQRARKVVAGILSAEGPLRALSREQLAERSLALRYRAQCGEPLERILIEAYSLVRESARRTIGMTHFETQLLGGVLLHRRTIAEMPTGEGKTLTATLPLYLGALPDKGAHLATANDYLARRDADWMRPVFAALGLSVGLVVAGQTPGERRAAYACDVTYGTAREFGFDFLRDRLRARQAAESQSLFFADDEPNSTASSSSAPVQRGLRSIVVDEADSLLIDEARVPLVISAAQPEDLAAKQALFLWSAETSRRLAEMEHFTLESEQKRAELTAAGREEVRRLSRASERAKADLATIGLPEIYDAIERALRVERYYLRDRHYVVRDGKVVIIDEFTGRPSEGRQWRDGVHQAVQAKEGLPVTPASGAAAQITVQEFFSQYASLSGMTGTAAPSAGELRRVYRLAVAPIPTHRPCLRVQFPTRVLPSADAKWEAIVDEVREMQRSGRPVLVGTRSIDKSEELAARLARAGIAHRVLHARNLAAEAEIVAKAGERGQVTVATNMAGRGTDIRLGPGVADIGGLHVVCSELHDAARIDRQLIGRAARQGDPGSYRQFLSLDDEILESGLGADRAARLRRSHATAGASLDALAGWFYRAQRQVERRHRSDRQLVMHQARERRQLHERMGQDPWLDATDAG
ncbi:MAG TPA: translocase [Planctomycetaceae bacterium]|nr:translocase [Planctomycetaceae bacterium]